MDRVSVAEDKMNIYGLKNHPSPCQGCKDRWVNETGRCHTTCEKYAEFKAKAAAENKYIAEERERFLRNPIAENKSMAQMNRIKKERKR